MIGTGMQSLTVAGARRVAALHQVVLDDPVEYRAVVVALHTHLYEVPACLRGQGAQRGH